MQILIEFKQTKAPTNVKLYESEKQQRYQKILEIEGQKRRDLLINLIQLSWAYMVLSSQDIS